MFKRAKKRATHVSYWASMAGTGKVEQLERKLSLCPDHLLASRDKTTRWAMTSAVRSCTMEVELIHKSNMHYEVGRYVHVPTSS